MRDANPKTIHLKDYQPPEYLIDTVDLSFDLRPTGTRVRSVLALRRNPASEVRGDRLRLDGEGLSPISIRLNGEEMPAERYRVDDESLTLHQPPDEFVLETEVEIAPEDNTALEGLYRSGGIFCTQCEAEGFRRITWFLDRPDVMARFTTTHRAPTRRATRCCCPTATCVEQRRRCDDGRHFARWDDPFPKPSYLFALVAGDLRCIEDRFTHALRARGAPARSTSSRENIDKCEHAMRSLKNAMRWDEAALRPASTTSTST